MAQKNRTYLKALWITLFKPAQSDYDDVWDSHFNTTDDLAGQSEAEIGAENTKVMTALRVLQSIVYQAANYVFSALNTTSKTIIGAINELASGKENASNKETSALDTSTTKYPCNNVVKNAVDAKLDDVTAGTNITIDKTDPKNPVISASGGGGSGNYIKSINNTFLGTIDFDVDEKYYNQLTQNGALNIDVNSNTNGVGSKAYIPIATDGNNIILPGTWIERNNDYVNDVGLYSLYVFYDGINYIYDLFRKSSSDTTPPTLDYAIAYDGQDIIDLKFTEEVNITIDGWSISSDGDPISIVSVGGNLTSTPVFLVSRNIVGTESIELSYTSTTGNTTDLIDNELVTFSNFDVVIDIASGYWFYADFDNTSKLTLNGAEISAFRSVDDDLKEISQATAAYRALLTSESINFKDVATFDGINDYYEEVLASAVNISTGTIECFVVVRTVDATSYQRILSFYGAASGVPQFFLSFTSSKLRVYLGDGSLGHIADLSHSVNVSNNLTYVVHFRFDASNIYIRFNDETEESLDKSSMGSVTVNNLAVGRINSLFYLNGSIAAFAIYTSVLTSNQRNNNMNYFKAIYNA